MIRFSETPHNLVMIFICVLMSIFIQNAECVKPTFYHVGLYSICSNKTAGNRTIRNNDAEIWDQLINMTIQKSVNLLTQDLQTQSEDWWCKVEYRSFDVCDDFEKLQRLALDFLFGRDYAFKDSHVRASFSNVIFIWTVLPDEMVKYWL